MSLVEYQHLLSRKAIAFKARGLTDVPDLAGGLFPHAAAVTRDLLLFGCGAAFLDTGLAKTSVALAWLDAIARVTGRTAMLLCPLACGPQHQREAERLGIDAAYLRTPNDRRRPRIVITNYERFHLWDLHHIGAIGLDESSILKSFNGKTKRALIEAFCATPYRLALTATPAPNDHMELGNHAEFLGVMRSREMLSRWFVNDTSTASHTWRLKGHARAHFWDWVASWARCASMPSDLGFSDEGFVLPELITHKHIVDADQSIDAGAERNGQARMFRIPETSATSIRREKKYSLDARADAIAAAVLAEPGEAWNLWVDTNDEADALSVRLKGAIEVRGSMKAEEKEARLVAFSDGRERVLITKARIAGFGLNWQHCARAGFAGLTYSYESFYQAVRRNWRFGQKRPVHVHIAGSSTEAALFEANARKADDHAEMKIEMAAAMRRAMAPSATRHYDAAETVRIPTWMK